MAGSSGEVTSLTRESGPTLHYQVSTTLRSAIASGRFGPGELLPGETTLMEWFEVSRATVRRALDTLQRDGLIERRAGTGTRVLATELPTPMAENLLHIEAGALNTDVAVLAFEWVSPPMVAATALNLAPGVEALKIVRVRSRHGVPLRHLTTYVSPSVGAKLDRSAVERSTLTFALEQAGYAIDRAEDEVGAVLADPDVAVALGIRVGEPLVEMTRTLRSVTEPLLFQWSLLPPTRYKLRLLVRRDDASLAAPDDPDAPNPRYSRD
jgi:GntR family transcriptional regulator